MRGKDGPGDVFGSQVCSWHLKLEVSSDRVELRSLSGEASASKAAMRRKMEGGQGGRRKPRRRRGPQTQ